MLNEWYWIMPNKILFDKDLKDKEKLLFVLISSLCAEKWYCWANNRYLSDKLWITPVRISIRVSSLQKKWYISVTIDQENGNKRNIAISENDKRSYWKRKEGIIENNKTPLIENDKHNSININSIKKEYNKKQIDKDFELFLSHYPINKWKPDAKKAFAKAIKKTTIDVMIKSINNQKLEKKTKEEKWEFAPSRPRPQKRLNKEYWNNDCEEVDKRSVIEDMRLKAHTCFNNWIHEDHPDIDLYNKYMKTIIDTENTEIIKTYRWRVKLNRPISDKDKKEIETILLW